ncbi:uncharacterized protein LOC133192911 [Saccostrea echinata]|uniref:uncharacterized protein LOC133192911 n=1 Tax=Saccostrea echinata TaxID=191078 RepID=UPI002A81A2B9|nr:uncharacterized protein LOC133192911 [Saccostrea echinata]
MMDNEALSSLHSGSLPGANVMVDGYLRGTCISNIRKSHANPFQNPGQMTFLDENTKSKDSHDRLTEHNTTARKFRKSTSNMREYNAQYNGLIIIPWEEFVSNPTQLNDLFHLEKTGFITFDPDEVNVFFHATRMNKPPLGNISENGKAWVLTVENSRELEELRLSLTERISVFGLTLVRKQSKQKQRAPCLLMLDPTAGVLGEQLNAHIMRCSKIMEQQGKFCIEISFNGSVERWCRKVTSTKCESVGAKLLITNGDEPENLRTLENILCCVVCLPIWAIQTAVIKLHREVAYQDLSATFDAEEILLHGSVGGIQNQRKQLFRELPTSTVFYTKSQETPAEDQGHKYICIKKYDKNFANVLDDNISQENQYETTSIYNLFEDKHKRTSFKLKEDRKSPELIVSKNVDIKIAPQSKDLPRDSRNNTANTNEAHSARHCENAVSQIYIDHKRDLHGIETYDEKDDDDENDLFTTKIHEPVKQNRLLKYERKESNDEKEIRKTPAENEILGVKDDFTRSFSTYQEQSHGDDASPRSDSHRNTVQNSISESGKDRVEDIGRRNDLKKITTIEGVGQFEKSGDKLQEKTSGLDDVSSNNTNEWDMDISDLESENSFETETEVQSSIEVKQPHRHNIQRRKDPRYDSRRKYLGVHTPKRKLRTSLSNADSIG